MSTNITMDGVSTLDTGSNTVMVNMNVESIAEVKVLVSGYQAEYGRSSGLQIMAVTKSGTNQFRGSVYDVERNSKWNANSRTNILNNLPKTVSKEKDWGYSIGGPIGKPGGHNKLFFFNAVEFRPRTGGNDLQVFRVPTALERAGDFSQTTDNNGNPYPYIRDPLASGACTATVTGDHSACFQDGGVLGRIPQNRLYPLGLNILKMWPLPTSSSVPGRNLEFLRPPEDTLQYQPAFRFDYQVMPSLRVSYKYQGQIDRKQVNQGTIPGFNDAITPYTGRGTDAVTANYNLSSTMFLEGTFGRAWNPAGRLRWTAGQFGLGRADRRPGGFPVPLSARQRDQSRLLRLRRAELSRAGRTGTDRGSGRCRTLPGATGSRSNGAGAPPNVV